MIDAIVSDVTGTPTVEQVIVDGKVHRVTGKCKRCGKCCEAIKCEHLSWGVENGVKVAICNIYWTRPWGCALFPRDPSEPLQEGCGFIWEEQ